MNHHVAKRESLRQPFPFARRSPFRSHFGLVPLDQPFVLAEAFAVAKVVISALMQTHHRVDAALQKSADRFEGAKASVGQKNFAFLEQIPQLGKQNILMVLQRAFDPLDKRPTGQAETAHQFGVGESTAGFLARRLGKSVLIGRCVGHRNPRAIDDFHAPGAPELCMGNPGLQALGGVLMNLSEFLPIQAFACFAVGSGIGIGHVEFMGRAPALNLS
jgi:hypothetical protein